MTRNVRLVSHYQRNDAELNLFSHPSPASSSPTVTPPAVNIATTPAAAAALVTSVSPVTLSHNSTLTNRIRRLTLVSTNVTPL